MNSLTVTLRLLPILLVTLLSSVSCSRVTLVYHSADFVIRQYANDSLHLTEDQLADWEPSLNTALDRHRSEELPLLAGFFDALLQASQSGFDQPRMTCLIASFREIYQHHARIAVTLASPLLASLTPAQIDRLERRFTKDARDDRADLTRRDWPHEQQKRARRYRKAIEGWVGSLQDSQATLVAGITARMPDSEAAIVDYRIRKREELLAVLRDHADASRIEAFMSAWLVDFSDLPPTLEHDSQLIGQRISELFIELGASLDDGQRQRLHKRLHELVDDLMQLQKQPRMEHIRC